MSRRILPAEAYDFYARDGRDGEEGPRRPTMGEAQRDARAMRTPLKPWQRCCIRVEWTVNERKVLRLLKRTPLSNSTGTKEDT